MSRKIAAASLPCLAGLMLLMLGLPSCSSHHGGCNPKTCQSVGATCGQISDGCGAALECGNCTSPESCGGSGIANSCANGLPPDPATVAPPLNTSTPTDFAASLEFLYSGDHPIQLGVAAGTIEAFRAALVRGQAHAADGSPLSGVTIDVLGHPELGSTLTRADGMFDLVVNGGAQLVVRYSRSGLLSAQRQVQAPWRGVVWAKDVVMIPQDSAVTAIDLSSATTQVAQSSQVTDDQGARHATVIVLPGTTAQMRMPDGSAAPLASMHVRATEYTVGSNGPAQMPADLPAQSAYTYAVAWSVDEAQAAGATSVEFNQPVLSYVENFLGFPVGTGIPAGYYDPAKGQWIAVSNGRVIKLLSVTAGLADIDANGDGAPDSADALKALGITDSERAQLATRFQAGQALWRVSVAHFTDWDFNMLPACNNGTTNEKCEAAKGGASNGNAGSCQQADSGSIILCQAQVLGEPVPISGTPYTLAYWSDRARKDKYSTTITVSGADALPVGLREIRAFVDVAGQHTQKTFLASPNLSFTFQWDGKDAFGRVLQGTQPVNIEVDNVYGLKYNSSSEFGDLADSEIDLNVSLREFLVKRYFQVRLGALAALDQGVGGWDFDVHHVYDPYARILYFGNGWQQEASQVSPVIRAFAGTGAVPAGGVDADGIPATSAKLSSPSGLAVGPDGAVFISNEEGGTVRRVARDGTITTVIGSGAPNLILNPGCELCSNPTCGGSSSSELYWQGDLDAWTCYAEDDGGAYEGHHYFDDHCRPGGREIYQDIDVSSYTSTIAQGTQQFAFGAAARGYGGPFPSVQFILEYRDVTNKNVLATFNSSTHPTTDWGWYSDTHVAPAGTGWVRIRVVTVGTETCSGGVYVDDLSLRALGPDGQGDNPLKNPRGLAVGPDGSLYIAADAQVWKRSPDGTMSPVAGTGEWGYSGDGGPATSAKLRKPWGLALGADGSLYITDSVDSRVRRVASNGKISTICGTGQVGDGVDGSLAKDAPITRPTGIALDSQGAIYFATYDRIQRIGPDGLLTTFAGGGDGEPPALPPARLRSNS